MTGPPQPQHGNLAPAIAAGPPIPNQTAVQATHCRLPALLTTTAFSIRSSCCRRAMRSSSPKKAANECRERCTSTCTCKMQVYSQCSQAACIRACIESRCDRGACSMHLMMASAEPCMEVCLCRTCLHLAGAVWQTCLQLPCKLRESVGQILNATLAAHWLSLMAASNAAMCSKQGDGVDTGWLMPCTCDDAVASAVRA